MQEKLKQLKERLGEVDDLRAAAAVLHWDQSTYMPPAGGVARGRQLATLERLAHEKFTDAGLGRLLDELHPWEEELDYDADEAGLLRATRRAYERALKVPPAFAARFAAHTAASYEVWARARPRSDFGAVRPYLEKTLAMSRQLADFFPGYEHPADPLIDFADSGVKTAEIRRIFAALRARLVPLVQAITAREPASDACLRQRFPAADQLRFALRVAERFGYDLERGRQDQTHHPYMTRFSLGDVRITTRVQEHFLGEALFSTLHETGHALYEQGIEPSFEGTPLAEGTSSGVHESQSRLWENLVGRSRGFWEAFYPELQEVFPRQLGAVPLEVFYRAINKVERSPIRTDADEVTYNLHVMIRFELELELLEGGLEVRDLPAAWRRRYRADLGIDPPEDRDGVLQDVHWYAGPIGGAFQGYTLGNILNAQFYQAALRAHPEIPGQIAAGEFATLHSWLKEHIYRHGSKYTAPELLERITGGPLHIEPYMHYLEEKYGALYGLE